MPRLFVIVFLAGGLLVVAAVVGAIVRDDPPRQLSLPVYNAMARSIGVGVPDLAGANRTTLFCGHLAADAEEPVRRIYLDCSVSVRMDQLRDLMDRCEDAACARDAAYE